MKDIDGLLRGRVLFRVGHDGGAVAWGRAEGLLGGPRGGA